MWFLQRALLVLLLLSCVDPQSTYSTPPQKLIVTHEGFRISIPDESEIQTFFFQGNVNRHIDFFDPNVIILSATEPINGEWSLEYKKKGLKPGDFINYWIHLRKDGIGYTSRSIHYQIKAVSSTTAESLSVNEIDAIFGPSDLSDDKSFSNRDSTEFSNTAVPSTTPQPLSVDEMIDYIFRSNGIAHKNELMTPKDILAITYPDQWVWSDEFTSETVSSTTTRPESFDKLIDSIFGPNKISHENKLTTTRNTPTITSPTQRVWTNEFTAEVISSTTPQPRPLDEMIDIIFESNAVSHENAVVTPKNIPTSTFSDQWVWPDD